MNKESICLHGGYKPKSGEANVLPIYQSTTYAYDTPEELAHLFDVPKDGHIYTRISNPTVAAFEEKVALLVSSHTAYLFHFQTIENQHRIFVDGEVIVFFHLADLLHHFGG